MTDNKIPVAIYTRKSTDAHVEQEVHSLSVQRASAESFIASQSHRGWQLLDEHFDDNNVSGATLDRPALERLKQRIIDGEVKAVVINRLDRISRSLSQFLELTEFFDAHEVSLVSVTQNFNTGDAMGKLMLHILLSFSEFERELIRDRVTERLHAARKKGHFIGGRPILGYNIKPQGRELEIDELEALRVRQIFELYLELASLKATVAELKEREWINKKWVAKNGNVTGGSPFSVNGLHSLLKNPIYIGKVTLKGEVYEGQHEAIIAPELFESVQNLLASNRQSDTRTRRSNDSALLKGLLYCPCCEAPYIHTYTKKNHRIYRYYTCRNRRENGANACPSPSVPAGEIEAVVTEQLLRIGQDSQLQEDAFEQIKTTLAEKKVKSAEEIKCAKQQLLRIDRELAQSREFDAPESLIQHLESKREQAESLLQMPENDFACPSKASVVESLNGIHELWPSFTPRERIQFTKALVKRIDFSASDGKLTLHFNEDGLIPKSKAQA